MWTSPLCTKSSSQWSRWRHPEEWRLGWFSHERHIQDDAALLCDGDLLTLYRVNCLLTVSTRVSRSMIFSLQFCPL